MLGTWDPTVQRELTPAIHTGTTVNSPHPNKISSNVIILREKKSKGLQADSLSVKSTIALAERTQVWFPAPTCSSQSSLTPVSWDSVPSGLLRHALSAHTQIRQNTYTKIKNSKKKYLRTKSKLGSGGTHL